MQLPCGMVVTQTKLAIHTRMACLISAMTVMSKSNQVTGILYTVMQHEDISFTTRDEVIVHPKSKLK